MLAVSSPTVVTAVVVVKELDIRARSLRAVVLFEGSIGGTERDARRSAWMQRPHIQFEDGVQSCFLDRG